MSHWQGRINERLIRVDRSPAISSDDLMNFKRFSPAITVSLVLTAFSLFGSLQVQAGASNKSGNPFGNGSFFPDSGNFSAILRSSNGFVGVMQFATLSTTPTVSTTTANDFNFFTGFSQSSTTSSQGTGVATIYANGQQFVGTAYGAIDTPAQQIAVTYFANMAGQVSVLPNVTYNAQTIITSTTTNTVYVPTYSTTNIALSNNCSGQFSATLQNSYPNQTFSGTGEANAFINDVSYYLTNSPLGPVYVYNVFGLNAIFETSVIGSRLTQ